MAEDAGTQQGAEGAQEQQGGEQQQQADPVLDRLNEFASGFEDRFGRLEGALGLDGEGQQQQPDYGAPFDPSTLTPQQQQAFVDQYGSFPQQQSQFQPQPQFDQWGNPMSQQPYGQPQFDQFGNPIQPQQQQQQIDPNQMRHTLSQLMGIDPDAVSRMGEQLERMQVERAAEQIEQRWPELATPEGAKSAIDAATQAAHAMGRPDLAGDPSFVEMTYLAGRAREGAQAETPAGADGVPLEQSGARGPGESEQDEGDLIVAAAQGARPAWHGDGG